jgi:hypothetical protein
MGGPGAEPSEEEIRAAYEAELKRLRVEHLLLEHVVGMVNLGMRRTGLAPGTEEERDPSQVRLAIESIRALMPLLEQTAPQQAGQIRSALSQLQLAFVRIGGQPGAPAGEAAAGGGADGPPSPGDVGQPGGGQAGGRQPGGGQPGNGPPGAGPPQPGGAPPRPGQEPVSPGEPGPAQRSGRLWIPGQ